MQANQQRHHAAELRARLTDPLRASEGWFASAWYAHQHNQSLPHDSPVLAFLPMLPSPAARMAAVARYLGMRITSRPVPGQPAIAWDSGTWFKSAGTRLLPSNAINASCLDVSKSHVDAVWARVSGHPVEVDPLNTEGWLVIKSELNGRHDGRLVQGPLKRRRRGHVYQRFVNSCEGNFAIELRAMVIGGSMINVVRRWRPAQRWFEDSVRNELQRPEEAFSAQEIANVLRFCKEIGLEYGELDVLRDNESGRIYVLDANRTPDAPIPAPHTADVPTMTRLAAEGLSTLLDARWPEWRSGGKSGR